MCHVLCMLSHFTSLQTLWGSICLLQKMESELRKEKWFCNIFHIVSEGRVTTQTYLAKTIPQLLLLYSWGHHMEICLIGILSHLIPEEVFYSPKVLREIRVKKATRSPVLPPTFHTWESEGGKYWPNVPRVVSDLRLGSPQLVSRFI